QSGTLSCRRWPHVGRASAAPAETLRTSRSGQLRADLPGGASGIARRGRTRAEKSGGLMFQLFKDLRQHHHALLTLFQVNVKTTVASARLGWLWWFIDPLVMMAIYYFIIHVVFQRGG